MDGIILSSSRESFPYAVLEGMRCGLPVICSDCGGLPDAVQDGINGWLVPRGSKFFEKLKDAIDDWASNAERRKSYGMASRRIISGKFSVDQMVKAHIHLYEEIVSQN